MSHLLHVTLIQQVWITDISLTIDNVEEIALSGRARWRVENEVFNTMKNLGYNLGHNHGIGKQNLSIIFTPLAFIIGIAVTITTNLITDGNISRPYLFEWGEKRCC